MTQPMTMETLRAHETAPPADASTIAAFLESAPSAASVSLGRRRLTRYKLTRGGGVFDAKEALGELPRDVSAASIIDRALADARTLPGWGDGLPFGWVYVLRCGDGEPLLFKVAP